VLSAGSVDSVQASGSVRAVGGAVRTAAILALLGGAGVLALRVRR
jgi:hypothetical protein